MADSGGVDGGPPAAEAAPQPNVRPHSDPLDVIRAALQQAAEDGEEGTGYAKLLKRLKDLGKAEAKMEEVDPSETPAEGGAGPQEKGHLKQLFAQLTAYARLTRGLTCERALLDAAAGSTPAQSTSIAVPPGDGARTSRAGAMIGEDGAVEQKGGEAGEAQGGNVEGKIRSVEHLSLAEALREGALAGAGDLLLQKRRKIYDEVIVQRLERRRQEIESAQALGIVSPFFACQYLTHCCQRNSPCTSVG